MITNDGLTTIQKISVYLSKMKDQDFKRLVQLHLKLSSLNHVTPDNLSADGERPRRLKKVESDQERERIAGKLNELVQGLGLAAEAFDVKAVFAEIQKREVKLLRKQKEDSRFSSTSNSDTVASNESMLAKNKKPKKPRTSQSKNTQYDEPSPFRDFYRERPD